MWKDFLFIFGLLVVLYMIYRERQRIREHFGEDSVADPSDPSDPTDPKHSKDPHLFFLSGEAVATFLERDEDEFVHNMTPLDLHARRVKAKEEYLQRIASAAMDFPVDIQKILTKSIVQADEFFENMRTRFGIDGAKAAELPWVFALTKGKLYEDGLPHTRANVIFLSSDMNFFDPMLVRTLIHEKIHVYQRMYRAEVQAYLEKAGYKRWKRRFGSAARIRANPDVDDWIYIHPKTGETMAIYYARDTPTAITDAETSKGIEIEHPFEEAAYEISRIWLKD